MIKRSVVSAAEVLWTRTPAIVAIGILILTLAPSWARDPADRVAAPIMLSPPYFGSNGTVYVGGGTTGCASEHQTWKPYYHNLTTRGRLGGLASARSCSSSTLNTGQAISDIIAYYPLPPMKGLATIQVNISVQSIASWSVTPGTCSQSAMGISGNCYGWAVLGFDAALYLQDLNTSRTGGASVASQQVGNASEIRANCSAGVCTGWPSGPMNGSANVTSILALSFQARIWGNHSYRLVLYIETDFYAAIESTHATVAGARAVVEGKSLFSIPTIVVR